MIKIPTLQEWYASLRADAKVLMDSPTEIPQLSFLNVCLVVFAGAIHQLGCHLRNVVTNILPDKATGEMLSRYLDVNAVTIDTGTPAEGYVQFTGAPLAAIPIGTLVKTISGIQYATTFSTTLPTSGISESVLVRCTDLGTIGNYSGTELTLVVAVPSINPVVTIVGVGIVGGTNADTETDSRDKLHRKIINPITIGLGTDYERIALEVSGVGRVWVNRASRWTGPNTTVVTVATKYSDPVSPSVLTDAINRFLDADVLQIGEITSVRNIVAQPVDITLSIIPNTSSMQSAVLTSIQQFFANEITPNETLLISAVRSSISSAGVEDYVITEMTTNGITTEPQNLIPQQGKKLSIGQVSFVIQ